jgi:hypothetical protein
MTPGEAKFLDWVFVVLGATLAFSGWRTIQKRHTRADGREYKGRAASRLGWLWLVLGLLFILAVVFDVSLLKSFGRLFMESTN